MYTEERTHAKSNGADDSGLPARPNEVSSEVPESSEPALPGVALPGSVKAVRPGAGSKTLEIKLGELSLTLTWSGSGKGDGEGDPQAGNGGSGTPRP